ncbi:MAG TPA: TlyA family RNA methyltransferase [Campylobacterales bacterium]|nr:TlyA family RNA methyltransferase [Campylobacterales bacterium]
MRLDKFLFKKGYVKSRNRAKEYIKSGFIKVDEVVIKKVSFLVEDSSRIEILQQKEYVSRAALKLKNFFKSFDNNFIRERVCLDVGASSGGFTQVLLENGAFRVYALDVGSSQLDKSLRDDKRVINLEKQDIRNFFFEKPFDLITCDVSFISIHKIISHLNRLAKSDLIILFKPQFEVGKEAKRDKRGVVLDKEAIKKSMIIFENETKRIGWKLIKKEPSLIKGMAGNEEFFYYFKKGMV